MNNASDLAGLTDEAVRKATGRDWTGWREHLDANEAANLTHPQIVAIISALGIKPWWCQMIAVGYERIVGKRQIGQGCDGKFAANASRTLPDDMDQALARWHALVIDRSEFAGAFAQGEPRISSTEKWRYWRVDLEDGTRVSLTIGNRPGGRSVAAIEHQKLPDAAASQNAKAFWKTLLGEM